jgi:hypothetical protein
MNSYFIEKLSCIQFREYIEVATKRTLHSDDINSNINLLPNTLKKYESYNCDVEFFKELFERFNSIDRQKYDSHKFNKNVNSIADKFGIPKKKPNSWRQLKKRREYAFGLYYNFVNELKKKCPEIDEKQIRSQWMFYAVILDCFFRKPKTHINFSVWERMKAELSENEFKLIEKWYKNTGNKYKLLIVTMDIKEILQLVKILYPFYHEK